MKKSLYKSSLWESKPLKVSILVPTRDMVNSEFAYCLTQMVKLSSSSNLDVYVFFDSSTILLNQREKLIEMAKDINSDYVLWLDSDMMFPPTTLLRLLEHRKEIVGCNYYKRSLPQTTVAYKSLKDWDSWIPMKLEDDLVEVEGVGFGCILMKTSIFKKLEKPYFEFSYKKETKDWMGEDFNLLNRLRKNKHKIYIDTVLSMDIKHLGIKAF